MSVWLPQISMKLFDPVLRCLGLIHRLQTTFTKVSLTTSFAKKELRAQTKIIKIT